jgi:predicted oxidoreductase (fatty acid repression mutant protein)
MANKHRKVWKMVSRKTNTAKRENTFLETKPKFSLTKKCFSLTNFFNNKQTQKNLKINFLKNKFQKTNKT